MSEVLGEVGHVLLTQGLEKVRVPLGGLLRVRIARLGEPLGELGAIRGDSVVEDGVGLRKDEADLVYIVATDALLPQHQRQFLGEEIADQVLLLRFFLIVDPVEEQGEDDPQLLCRQRGPLIAQLLQYLSHA